MKYIKIVNIVILSIIMVSCTQKNHVESNVYFPSSLEIQNNKEMINLNLTENIQSDFYNSVDSIKLIKLESTKESIIGNISKIYIVNDTLFVFDYFKSKTIFAFDLKGHFLYKINKIGRGPGEYESINMAHIIDNVIFIKDPLSWKLIRYDLTGKFLSEIKITPHPADFIAYKDTLLLGYTEYNKETPYRLVITDSILSQKSTALSFFNTRPRPLDPLSEFQKTNDGKFLYRCPPNDTIYQIKSNAIIPKYYLGLNDNKELVSFYQETMQMNNNEFITKIRYSNIVINYLFLELDDFIYVNYLRSNILYTSLISKKQYQSKNFITVDINNKTSYTPFYNVNGIYENSLIVSIDDRVLNGLNSENKEVFLSHFNSSNDKLAFDELENGDNNALVCLIYIKEF